MTAIDRSWRTRYTKRAQVHPAKSKRRSLGRRLGVVVLTLGATFIFPETAAACERCFGAGVDAPAVRAVSASMLVLFAIISGVFGGILSFFRNMSVRAAELAAKDDSTSLTDPEAL